MKYHIKPLLFSSLLALTHQVSCSTESKANEKQQLDKCYELSSQAVKAEEYRVEKESYAQQLKNCQAYAEKLGARIAQLNGQISKLTSEPKVRKAFKKSPNVLTDPNCDTTPLSMEDPLRPKLEIELEKSRTLKDEALTALKKAEARNQPDAMKDAAKNLDREQQNINDFECRLAKPLTEIEKWW